MSIFGILARVWIPVLMTLVVIVGGYAVWRLRGEFSAHRMPTYAGSMTDGSSISDPKHVRYEVFGPAGSVADINYLDQQGQPHQVNAASLPWSLEVVTTAPSMTGNVVAQGNSGSIGCRISADDTMKAERVSSAPNAYVYCFVRSA